MRRWLRWLPASEGMPPGDRAAIDEDPMAGCTVDVGYAEVSDEIDLGVFASKEAALEALQLDVNSRRPRK